MKHLMKLKNLKIQSNRLLLITLGAGALALLLCLSGCVFDDVDKMYTLPESSEIYVTLQTRINEALVEDIENYNDPEQIANIARDRLGLLEQDEMVFVDTSN